ncbi:transmembrane channel-like protein 5 isoform X2 [Gigantopelta aegis]|uniref:transmembrane channel-like protein 5 isoform X2 n=1 Tax=Gigantopelta aegis TaxID=1735272 RepID=UPI001B88952D|nr:transmembrane channel-like protein 5 isoform X2 [Gigantopelta aegis]
MSRVNVKLLEPGAVDSQTSTLSELVDEQLFRNMRQGKRKLSVAQVFTARMIGNIEEDQKKAPNKEEDNFFEIGDKTLASTKKCFQRWHVKAKGKQKDFRLVWIHLKKWYRRLNNKVPENPILNKQIKVMEGHFGSGIGTMFEFIRWVLVLNIGLSIIWATFIVFPMAVKFDYSSPKQNFAYKHLLNGQGPVGTSWFFFGAYLPWVERYHMGLAYLLVILVTYFGSLLIILLSIAASEEPISGSKEFNQKYAYSLILWTSWDHSVTTEEATTNLSKGIASAFKDHLYEQKVKERKLSRKEKDPHAFVARRCLAWFITIFLTAGGCTGIIFLEIILQVNRSQKDEDDMAFLRTYFTPVFISLINVIVPFCIRMLAKIEHYVSGQTELNITVARIFVLRMAHLATLIASVYYRSSRMFVPETVAEMGLYFGCYFWTQQKDEFIISSSVLVLIYRQSLILCGSITCPVLPLIGVLSILEFFYLNYIIMLYTCKPPIKRWKQSRKTQFIMTFLLLSILCLIIPVSIVIGSDAISLGATEKPGVFVGPFRDTRVPTEVVNHFVNSIESKTMQSILRWLGSHTVMLPLVLMLLCLLFYQYKRFIGEHKHALILQIELQQERADNKLLAKKLYEQIHTE